MQIISNRHKGEESFAKELQSCALNSLQLHMIFIRYYEITTPLSELTVKQTQWKEKGSKD